MVPLQGALFSFLQKGLPEGSSAHLCVLFFSKNFLVLFSLNGTLAFTFLVPPWEHPGGGNEPGRAGAGQSLACGSSGP